MRGPSCTDVERAAAELADGAGTSGVPDPRLEHAKTCPRCTRTLARARRLDGRLRDLPAGAGPGPAPRLPERAPGRLVRLPWVAAAAAALLAAVAGSIAVRGRGGGAAGSPGTETAYRVVDEESLVPGSDDRILALSAGAETVAARRPAERR